MDGKQFSTYRKKLHKTQKQMAELLGVSLKAIHSYEQGWRSVPGHIERQLLFLFTRLKSVNTVQKQCWSLKSCPPERKKKCPAWEFQTGKLCWFINGTICDGSAHKSWEHKMQLCRDCDVFKALVGSIEQI